MGRNALLAIFALAVAVLVALAFVGCHSDSSSDTTAADIVSPSQAGSQGDFNENGTPDVTDAVALLRIIVGLDPANELADCNCDGQTTISDAILLLRCVVGLDDWPLVCGADVPLGSVRTIQPGDRWEYAVTGSYTPDGGAPVPATATNGYWELSAEEIDLGFETDDAVHALTTHWDVGHPNGAYVEHWVVAVAQTAAGALRFYGLSGGEGEPFFDTVATPERYHEFAEVLNPGSYEHWETSFPMTNWEDGYSGSYDAEGIEVIEVNGVTYECYKGSLTMNIGFEMPIDAWLNPRVGGVRLIFHVPEQNASSTQQLDLQSFNFEP